MIIFILRLASLRVRRLKIFNASEELRQLSKNDAKRSRSRTKTSFTRGSRSSESSVNGRNRLSYFDSASAEFSSDDAKKHNRKFRKKGKPGFLLKR